MKTGVMDMRIETRSYEETFSLGKIIGGCLNSDGSGAPVIIALDGELGSGKTAFTGGLAAGLMIEGPVLSPSFTIVKEYQGAARPFYHIDLYRLYGVSDLMSFDFYEYAGKGNSVTAVEWAGKFGDTSYFPAVPSIFIKIDVRRQDGEIIEDRNVRNFFIEFKNFDGGLAGRIIERVSK